MKMLSPIQRKSLYGHHHRHHLVETWRRKRSRKEFTSISTILPKPAPLPLLLTQLVLNSHRTSQNSHTLDFSSSDPSFLESDSISTHLEFLTATSYRETISMKSES